MLDGQENNDSQGCDEQDLDSGTRSEFSANDIKTLAEFFKSLNDAGRLKLVNFISDDKNHSLSSLDAEDALKELAAPKID